MMLTISNVWGLKMGDLRMAIIDKDKKYMESLAGYIASNYGLSLSPCCFTNLESFTESSKRTADAYDIVLIAPELYEKNALAGLSKSVVFLEKEALYPNRGMPSIFKYRHCDSIVGELLEIQSLSGNRDFFLCGGLPDARVIAVYSPIGGSGKSTIAAGLSVQCARRGMKVLYLNFERASCTSAFFNPGQGVNLSRVMLSIKCGSGFPAKHGGSSSAKHENGFAAKYCNNFSAKHENGFAAMYCNDFSAKCGNNSTASGFSAKSIMNASADSEINGLSCYLPPESPFEWDELSVGEYVFFLDYLKNAGVYNIVIIDMDSCVSEKNLHILQKCDVILLLTVRGAIAAEKMNVLYREILRMDRANDHGICTKIVAVENKHIDREGSCLIHEAMPGFKVDARLPYSREIENSEGCEVFFNEKNGFVRAISNLAGIYAIEKSRRVVPGRGSASNGNAVP
jgi:hypothetical protein